MKLSTTFTDFKMKAINAIHGGLVAVSGGRVLNTLATMPVVKVTTIGRTSGKPRTVILTTPIQENGRYVLVASKGGDDRHPDWYRNLVANPEIMLDPLGAGEPIKLTARTATPEEKAQLWPRIEQAYQGYSDYQAKTDRDIPVVICE